MSLEIKKDQYDGKLMFKMTSMGNELAISFSIRDYTFVGCDLSIADCEEIKEVIDYHIDKFNENISMERKKFYDQDSQNQ